MSTPDQPEIPEGDAPPPSVAVTQESKPMADGEKRASLGRRQSLQLGPNVIIDYEDLDEEDEEDVKVRWNMRRTTDKPCACCLQLCGVWLFLMLLLLILMAAVGSVEFSLDVPFYDRSEINQQREDAYSAMESDATFLSTFGQDGNGECIHDDPTVLTRNGTLLQGPMPSQSCQRSSSQFLRILYLSKDRTSNVLTEQNLKEIQKVEDRILSELELTRRCYLIDSTYPALETRNVSDWIATISDTINDEPQYVACERINSVLNFLDPLYFDREANTGLGYYLLPNDQIIQDYNYSSLDDVVSFWSKYTLQPYDISDYDFAVATVGESVTVPNLFWRVTSTDFQVGSTEAVGVTSTYALGLPINEYFSSTEKADDQYGDIGKWLWDTYDSYLKDLDIDGIDIYWADSEGGMQTAESGQLALQSIILFPFSLVIVLLYLMYMQDSLFIGLMGIMQILLSFVPVILVYRYVVGQEYIGVLQLIAIYVILGIGMDNIFVFCDQFHHQKDEKRFDVRMQKTFSTAASAMFTTSCTTFISFLSTATSVFPAVSTFGIFSALLVLFNYLAVITFFPAVYAVYHTRVRTIWWDHPSLLLRCKRPGKGTKDESKEDKADVEEDGPDKGGDEESTEENQEAKQADNDESEGCEGSVASDSNAEKESGLVVFFRDTWAPLIIKFRFPIIVVFLAIFVAAIVGTTQLSPDENAPSTLPDGNNYLEYPEELLEYFARAGNPRAIEVRWVSGINPDDPIDRAGTDDTDTTDYGSVNYLDCSTFDPTTPLAQVWSLQTCHDMFFSNQTDYHVSNDPSQFGLTGIYGSQQRLLVTQNVPVNEFSYYDVVSCPMQGMRDWMLTDSGCAALQALGLPCYDETSQRVGCSRWDTNGNSCEPFPADSSSFLPLFVEFLQDESTDPLTQQTNFDKYKDQVFVADNVKFGEDTIIRDDFLCRSGPDGSDGDQRVMYGMATLATLDQDFAQSYQDGIDLYDKWDAWSAQMRTFAPREMIGTMQISNGGWAFYFLNQTLLRETAISILLALGLSFLVLTFVGGNIILAAMAVFTIILIVVDVLAFTILVGWSLGVIEAVNYVVVIGMSIDYAVHMSAAYKEAEAATRSERVILMLEEMGVSVLSGALSTLLAIFLMFFAPNNFFVKFATFLFVTIALSCIYSMTFFPALLAVIGPLGDKGEIYARIKMIRRAFFHKITKAYVQSKAFVQQESKTADRKRCEQSDEQSEEQLGAQSEVLA